MSIPVPHAPSHFPIPAVLLVDPDEDSRKLHRAMLQSMTGEIDEAEDGAEALARALAHPPSLVVTELRLPRVDGYALCRMLRTEPATSRTRILVVSSSASPVDMERARRAGADDVLLKPLDPQQVRDRARALVQRTRELRDTSAAVLERGADELARSAELLEKSRDARRRMMSRTLVREQTTTPPAPPDAALPRVRRVPDVRLQPGGWRQSEISGAVGLPGVQPLQSRIPLSPSHAAARSAVARHTPGTGRVSGPPPRVH